MRPRGTAALAERSFRQPRPELVGAGDAELAERARQVILDRGRRQERLPGDLLGGQPGAGEVGDLPFPGRSACAAAGRRGPARPGTSASATANATASSSGAAPPPANSASNLARPRDARLAAIASSCTRSSGRRCRQPAAGASRAGPPRRAARRPGRGGAPGRPASRGSPGSRPCPSRRRARAWRAATWCRARGLGVPPGIQYSAIAEIACTSPTPTTPCVPPSRRGLRGVAQRALRVAGQMGQVRQVHVEDAEPDAVVERSSCLLGLRRGRAGLLVPAAMVSASVR